MLASVVVRTLNEERYLAELLEMIELQESDDLDVEVVLVDSGSTDRTLEIAREGGCRIVPIERKRFSFGRSLNVGCGASNGELLVFVSGHCVPADSRWLAQLVAPLVEGRLAYAYGRQIGGPGTRFSERQVFRRQFPATSRIPQQGFFCNNANAALLRRIWEKHPFDEELTGLEDLALGRELALAGERVGYVAEARVLHHHDETFREVVWRYEREALALRHILPEVHFHLSDFLRCLGSGELLDAGAALQNGELRARLGEIARFRFAQYWGTYRGHREHRRDSKARKEHYFFPREDSR